ncbi:hypothetical protein PPGU19_084810 (plasmid) [Paraburkholderia sp. PGU19]|nr:hypothetical protein PPGU19_084810 [Paraburkholderia sp. PGU19]
MVPVALSHPSGPLGDIDSLLHEIGKLGASQIGIVLKIETRKLHFLACQTGSREGYLHVPRASDAAVSSRTGCVMLNKGPHIREALRILTDVINELRNTTPKRPLVYEVEGCKPGDLRTRAWRADPLR